MSNSISEQKQKLSYGYLLIGFVFLFFYNGRWILPVAAFLAPLFIIRFMRMHKPVKGFLFILPALMIVNVVVWQGMIPVPDFVYYIIAFIMSLSTALTFLVDRIYAGRLKGFISTLIFPSAYVVMDFVSISTNPSGSFGTLAHTQNYLPLLQILSVTGIWGVSFIILWSASVINWLWDGGFEKAQLKKALVTFVIPFVLILLVGQIRIAFEQSGSTVRIASINISPTALNDRYNSGDYSLVEKNNDLFLSRCKVAADSGAKIVFGIEIVIRLKKESEQDYISKAKGVAEQNRIYLGLPMEILPEESENALPMNKIVWLSPKGEILFSYHKGKPTPGEGNYGDGIIKSFDSPYGKISSAICFDMDFPAYMNQVASRDIDIMLVPGMDWREIAPYHTRVASFRAIEHGFNLIRAATKGLSASFDYKGQLISSHDFYTSDELIMYSDVPIKGQQTLYSMLGDYFAWLCVLFLLGATALFFREKRKNRQLDQS